MNTWFIIVGVMVLFAILYEAFWTTMGIGGGPATRRFSHMVWRCALGMKKRWFKSDWFLAHAGVASALSSILMWLIAMWLGWSLIFLGGGESIVNSSTGDRVDGAEAFYFAGTTLLTLGPGDYVPANGVWQLLTIFCSFTGLLTASLSITYLLPMVQAAADKRKVALEISAMGTTPNQILKNYWDGESFERLEGPIAQIASEISEIEQSHITYPVLHFFHSTEKATAITLSITALDEALTIIEHGMLHDGLMDAQSYRPSRQLITEFLNTVKQMHLSKAAEIPPLPSLQELRNSGLPVVADAIFHERIQNKVAERRRLLRALVENDGHHWSDLYTCGSAEDADQPIQDGSNFARRREMPHRPHLPNVMHRRD